MVISCYGLLHNPGAYFALFSVFVFSTTVAATAFYKEQPVIDFLQDVLGGKRYQLKDYERRKFAKEIKGVCIRIQCISGVYEG